MKRFGITLKTAIIFAVFISIILSGCSRNNPEESSEGTLPYWNGTEGKWNGTEGKYVKVSQNLSAYGIRIKDYYTMFFLPHFYVDEDRTTEVVGSASNNTWKLWVPTTTTDIYVVPPRIALLDEVGEQQISLDQDYPIQADGFSIASIFIPKLVGQEPYENIIHLQMFLVSENNQYPEMPTLLYDGKRYPLSRFGAELDEEDNVVYFCVSCEMPDLYTASMALAFGELHYSKLQTIIPADKAAYTCADENIKIHIIALED